MRRRRPAAEKRASCSKFEIGTPVFALLPGSRMSELEMHAELLLKTAADIVRGAAARRGSSCRWSAARRANISSVSSIGCSWSRLPLKLLYGHADHALRAADVGIVASGTATLEAAMARCPHLVFYRVNPITAEYRRAQAAAALCRTAQHSCRALCRAGIPAGGGDGAQSRPCGAEPLRRRRYPAPHSKRFLLGWRDALQRIRATIAAEAVATELRAAGVAC